MRRRFLNSWLAIAVMAGALAACSDRSEPAKTDSAANTTTTGVAGPPVVPGGPAELPVPRTEVAGTRWAGRIVVGGGLTTDGAASRLIHAYDPAANRWIGLPDLPVPLHHFGLVVFGDRLWAIGGYTNRAGRPWQALSAVQSLGVDERSWRAEPGLGSARGAFGAAVVGDRLVVAGGESGGRALPRVDVLVAGATAWTEGPALFQPREHLAVAASGGRIWAMGGRVQLAGNLATVESWDPTGSEQSWRRGNDLAYARSGIAADDVNGRLCVAGGEEGAGTIASVECHDAAGDTWQQVANLATPRHGLAVVTFDGQLHVVGGGPQPGLTVSAAHEVLTL